MAQDAASTTNTLYLESLYTQYQADPSKLDVPGWNMFFVVTLVHSVCMSPLDFFCRISEAKWGDYFAAMEAGQKAEPPAMGSSLRPTLQCCAV